MPHAFVTATDPRAPQRGPDLEFANDAVRTFGIVDSDNRITNAFDSYTWVLVVGPFSLEPDAIDAGARTAEWVITAPQSRTLAQQTNPTYRIELRIAGDPMVIAYGNVVLVA